MQRLIFLTFIASFFLTAYAQKINEYGEKVIKELLVSSINDNGEKIPKEWFVYSYDINLRLNGIMRRINLNYSDCSVPLWVVTDSIGLMQGEIYRSSYDYDREKKTTSPDGYTYTYALDNNRCITQIVKVAKDRWGSVTKFINNYWYNDIGENGRPSLVKWDWVEWWYPIEDKQWYRQGRPLMTVLDYGCGIWTYRKIDKTPDELLRQKQKIIDYDAPDNLNIDISGLLHDDYFYDPDYRCESMVEWMPRRLNFFPKDRIRLNKYAPYKYDKDKNGNVVKIRGYWLDPKDNILHNTILIELEYL